MSLMIFKATLIIFYAANGNNGVAVNSVDFYEMSSCVKALEQVGKTPLPSVPEGHTKVSAICVQK